MILSDNQILVSIESGKLGIDPFNKSNVKSASVDLTLNDNFLILKNHQHTHITIDNKLNYEQIKSDEIVISAHSFILASTKEYLKIPSDISSLVEGKSSIGRIGLFIQNAGLISPGFQGSLTLELYNANNVPILLKAGINICQLVFLKMTSQAKNPYQGHYQHQKNTTAPIFKQSTNNIVQLKNNEDDIYEKIAIGCDHAGWEVKNKVISYLEKHNYQYIDCGTSSDSATDYPIFAKKVAEMVSLGKVNRAILVCGSGVGMYITANRFKNVRAALGETVKQTKFARLHNDINILSLAQRSMNINELGEILNSFLTTKFEGGRHKKRINLID